MTGLFSCKPPGAEHPGGLPSCIFAYKCQNIRTCLQVLRCTGASAQEWQCNKRWAWRNLSWDFGKSHLAWLVDWKHSYLQEHLKSWKESEDSGGRGSRDPCPGCLWCLGSGRVIHRGEPWNKKKKQDFVFGINCLSCHVFWAVSTVLHQTAAVWVRKKELCIKDVQWNIYFSMRLRHGRCAFLQCRNTIKQRQITCLLFSFWKTTVETRDDGNKSVLRRSSIRRPGLMCLCLYARHQHQQLSHWRRPRG